MEKMEKMEKMFDGQIQILKDKGCPEQIVEILQKQRGSVIQKATGMTFGEGHVPFLPVVPRSFLPPDSPYSRMAMVTDVADAPSEPYYIYDVDDSYLQARLGSSYMSSRYRSLYLKN